MNNDARRRYGSELCLDRLKREMIETNKQMSVIAHEMGVTEGTLRKYSYDLYRREKVTGRIDLMHLENQRLLRLLEGRI